MKISLLISAIALALPAFAQSPPASNVKEQFVGTWKLISVEQRRPNGEIVYPRGKAPAGLLIYDRSGHMAVQIMNENNPGASPDAALDQLKAAVGGYGAYFGTYEVQEKEGFVVHNVQGSLFKSYRDSHQKRFFEFSGNRLVLTPPPVTVDGETRTTRLTWERVARTD